MSSRTGGATIYVEVEARTRSSGLDVDTMYGQLLRHMGDEPRARTRYAASGRCGSTATGDAKGPFIDVLAAHWAR